MSIEGLNSTPRVDKNIERDNYTIIQEVNKIIHSKNVVCYLFADQSVLSKINKNSMKVKYSQPLPLLISKFDIAGEGISEFVAWKGYSNQHPINKKTKFSSKLTAYIQEDYYINVILWMSKYNIPITLLFMSITRDLKKLNIGGSSNTQLLHRLYPHFLFKADIESTKILASSSEFVSAQLNLNIEELFFEGDDEVNISIGQ